MYLYCIPYDLIILLITCTEREGGVGGGVYILSVLDTCALSTQCVILRRLAPLRVAGNGLDSQELIDNRVCKSSRADVSVSLLRFAVIVIHLTCPAH